MEQETFSRLIVFWKPAASSSGFLLLKKKPTENVDGIALCQQGWCLSRRREDWLEAAFQQPSDGPSSQLELEMLCFVYLLHESVKMSPPKCLHDHRAEEGEAFSMLAALLRNFCVLVTVVQRILGVRTGSGRGLTAVTRLGGCMFFPVPQNLWSLFRASWFTLALICCSGFVEYQGCVLALEVFI